MEAIYYIIDHLNYLAFPAVFFFYTPHQPKVPRTYETT